MVTPLRRVTSSAPLREVWLVVPGAWTAVIAARLARPWTFQHDLARHELLGVGRGHQGGARGGRDGRAAEAAAEESSQ